MEDTPFVFLDRATPSYTAIIERDGNLVIALDDMDLYRLFSPRRLQQRAMREEWSRANRFQAGPDGTSSQYRDTYGNNNDNNGIYLYSSSGNTITGNTCYNNDSDGIYLGSSNNNTVTGNTCIRRTGQPSDYTLSQYTIRLSGPDSSYNLISSNNCMGKDVTIEDGTSNTSVNNKYN